MINLSLTTNGDNDTASFAADVAEGLGRPLKTLSSRYFYDAMGSRLFQEIMRLPEYYLTRSEHHVLTENKAAITDAFSENDFFHLIDLGAGDGLKTKILLRQLANKHIDFSYIPVDISEDAVKQLEESLQTELPAVKTQGVVGEYFTALEWISKQKSGRKVVLFLGSNIGNFEIEDSKNFLKNLRTYLQPGDKLLVGFDLRKDPEQILKAYDDSAGITADFNINLLRRINAELGGNFDLNQFRHFALYDPAQGAMRSYLVSKIAQEVTIGATGLTFTFTAWEPIHTENSYKYTLPQAAQLAESCGFKVQTVFQDHNGHFADVLFSVA